MRNLITTIMFIIGSWSYAQDMKVKESRPKTYNYQRGVDEIQNNNYEEGLKYLNKEVLDNPKNGYAFSWIAMVREQQEEHGKALTAANLSLKYLPSKDTEYLYFAHEVRAKVFEELGDTASAIADHTAAIKINPEQPDAYENRAQLYYEQKNYELADEDYKKLIALDQGSVTGYLGIGRNFKAQKQWDQAIVQFDRAIKLHTDDSQAYAFRAESYLETQNWDKATDDILTALRIDSNDKAFYMMQELEEAPFAKLKVKLQIESAKESNNERWPYYLGIMHEKKQMFSQAIKYYEEANNREHSVYTLERIARCYNDNGQYKECLDVVNEALDMDPERKSLLNLKANTLYDLDNAREAIAEWDKILAIYPDYGWGYYKRGWIKMQVDDIDGGIEDQTLSITIEPTYTNAYLTRANLYEKQGKNELAQADYKKIIEIESTPDEYQVSMYAFQALGNDKMATAVMDTVISHNRAQAAPYYEAACLYSRMNRCDEALTYLGICLDKGYKHFAHIDYDHDLDNLRELPKFMELIRVHRMKENIEEQSNTDYPEAEKSETVSEIPFSKNGNSGLCNVKCTINELPLYFIFDTGASDVSLSQVEATFMMKNGYLTKKDVVGNAYFSDAVGNVNVGTVINLRKVNFGGLELTNVKASVVKNQRAPLLLGQSVLGRLGKIEIDNSKHVLKISHK